MTNEEFVRNEHCSQCQPHKTCESESFFCQNAKDMVKLGKLLDGENPDKMDTIFEEFTYKELCKKCQNPYGFSDEKTIDCAYLLLGIGPQCGSTQNLRKILEWKKEEKQKATNWKRAERFSAQ